MKTLIRTLLFLMLVGYDPPSWAQVNDLPRDLRKVELDDLLNVEITTATRRREETRDVPAAVYVITPNDIRRSGVRTVPELLRMVPGVHVAQINANNWAISVRGLGSVFTDNLLVMVDGRSVYNRAFSGVFWNAQDLLLEDIDRIEVTRGPGGSLWGANAVNGVINIVTKSTIDTQGGFVQVGADTSSSRQGAARYGGRLGSVSYRVYSQWSDHGGFLSTSGTTARDNWDSFTNGARFDWRHGVNALSFESGIVTGEAHPMWVTLSGLAPNTRAVSPDLGLTQNVMVRGRWSRSKPDGARLRVQTSYDQRHRKDSLADEREAAGILDAQYHTPIGNRHDMLFGGSYRAVEVNTNGTFMYSMVPPKNKGVVASVFLQDTIAASKRVALTLGSKVEHDTLSAAGVQPSVRVLWKLDTKTRVWMAASRALRTPSTQNRNALIRYNSYMGRDGLPVVVGVVGYSEYQTERFTDVEAGYRAAVIPSIRIDLTAFRGHYNGLTTYEPVQSRFETSPAPHVFVARQFDNLLDADTTGAELNGDWRPNGAWRLEGSLSAFHLTPKLRPQSRDDRAARFDGNSPSMQWQLRSTLALGPKTEASGSLFHVGALRGLGVPAYTRSDLRVQFNVTSRVTLTAIGQNLFDASHQEYRGMQVSLEPTLARRTANAQLTWRF